MIFTHLYLDARMTSKLIRGYWKRGEEKEGVREELGFYPSNKLSTGAYAPMDQPFNK